MALVYEFIAKSKFSWENSQFPLFFINSLFCKIKKNKYATKSELNPTVMRTAKIVNNMHLSVVSVCIPNAEMYSQEVDLEQCNYLKTPTKCWGMILWEDYLSMVNGFHRSFCNFGYLWSHLFKMDFFRFPPQAFCPTFIQFSQLWASNSSTKLQSSNTTLVI